MLNLERWEELRSCCRDDAAFDRLKQILSTTAAHDAAGGVLVSDVPVSDASQSDASLPESVALAQAQLEIQRQNALATAIARIRESLNLQDIFATTTHELRQLLDAHRIAIYRFYPDFSGEFVAESVESDSPSVLSRASDSLNHSFFTPPRLDGDRQVIPLPEHGKSPAEILESSGSRSSAIVPILQGDALWGLLAASHAEADRPWHANEIELLDRVSINLSVALKQAELFQRTQQQARQLAKAAQREKTLAVTVEKIRRSLDIDNIFATTTHEVRQLLDVDRVAVYYFNPDWSGQFVAESVSPGWVSLLELQAVTPQLQGSLAVCGKMQKLIQAQQSIPTSPAQSKLPKKSDDESNTSQQRVFSVEDVDRAGFGEAYLEILRLYQCRSYAIVPIYQGNSLWGMLAAYHNASPRRWVSSDIDLLVQIGEHLGVALQQAELLEQTRMQARRLAQTLQDLQKTQTQLIHSEKMAGLGQLVAGVAHEINNPVNFIYGNLTYVRDYAQDLIDLIGIYRGVEDQIGAEATDVERGDEMREQIRDKIEEIDLDFIREDLPNLITSMKTGAERIRQIVKSLRIFSRLDEAQKKTVDLHEGIESVLWLLKHRLNEDKYGKIKIIKKFGELPRITCYAAELNQVFMNLLNNALDALVEMKRSDSSADKQPTIAIVTEQLDGDTVSVRIADNGTGIPEQVKARIFDPFFTTKAPGKGTGLGLSVSYQIVVENHGGELSVKSKPGVGTEFALEIPIRSVEDELLCG